VYATIVRAFMALTGAESMRVRNLLVASMLATVAGVRLEAAQTRTGAPRPNIVLIMSDDMGYSDLGCYGSEIRTPTLDRLASTGLRFSQFYNMARCCPTRAALLTGLHPHQAGLAHMTGAPNGRPEPWQGYLSRHAVTIAEVLRGAGYSTYMCGKWHVANEGRGGNTRENWPLQRGFQRFYGTITGGGSYYDPTTLTRDNTRITPDNDPEYHPEHFYYTDAITDNAVKFIRDHTRKSAVQPLFLYVAYTAAHWPMHAPEELIARYRGRYDAGYEPIRRARFERLKQLGLINSTWELSPQAGHWETVEHKRWEARCMEVYAAMIDRMDEGIGRIVAELEKQALFEDTLILFLQDNGGCAEPMGREDKPEWHLTNLRPMGPDELQPKIWPPMQTRDGRPVLGGPGVMPGGPDTYVAYGRSWANVSNTPFREYKHWVHEGGISTPLIAHWPKGMQRRGEIESQPGQVIDLMPTCVELAGATYPGERQGVAVRPMEGRSLVPAFAGERIDRDALYWEHEGNRAIRMGRWKLVAKGPRGPWELYDMERDRTELHDLAARQPGRVTTMIAKWEAWARRAGVLPWIWKPPYGNATRQAEPRTATRPR
jgi:arylsulfatase A-like enzyme